MLPKVFARLSLLFTVLALVALPAAHAQRAQQPKEQAPLVIDGVVREIFRSARQTQIDYLVQITVQRAELRPPRESIRVLVPAPGDDVYVQIVRTPSAGGAQDNSAGGHRPPPQERAQIRAYLYPQAQRGWTGAFPDWFELTANTPAPARQDDPPPAAQEQQTSNTPAPMPPSVLQTLGLAGDTVEMGDRIALRVSVTSAGSPAQRAGLEPGDMIVAANGAALTSLDQLTTIVRQGGSTLKLTVLDIKTGKATPVTLDLNAAAPAPTLPATPAPAPAPAPAPDRNLGLNVESVTVGNQGALKVTAVQQGSPAHKAGFEPGDLIVAANGTPLSRPEQLNAAVRQSGGTLTLTVRDVRSGRNVEVKVNLGNPAPGQGGVAPNTPALPNSPAAPAAPSSARSQTLGIRVESTFANNVPAVKVSQVVAGSPAQKAGIEVGDVITAVNDVVTIDPDVFDQAVGKSSASLTLSVIDPRNGKAVDVKVDLGQ